MVIKGRYNAGAFLPHRVRRFASLVESLAPHSCALWLWKGEPGATGKSGEAQVLGSAWVCFT